MSQTRKTTQTGFELPCQTCEGKGRVLVKLGLFKSDPSVVNCPECHGTGTKTIPFVCSLMALGNIRLAGSTNVQGNIHLPRCIGESCNLWDHDSYEGGCLVRKAMKKIVYSGN